MHCDIVNIRAETVSNVVTVALGLGCLAEMLLLVDDEVLRACNDASLLYALDGLSHQNTGQGWVGTKALPITSARGCSAKRPSDRTELNIDALAAVLLTHGLTSGISHATVPGRCNIDAGGKGRVVVG